MNIIDAIIHLAQNPVTRLAAHGQGRNRANSMGDALEAYAQDLFADTFACTSEERLRKISRVFSYLGNTSNPPDAMLWGGDAIEVKKIESENSALALNSSYPKHTLKASNPMLSAACREAEAWMEKDMIYVVGVVSGDRLKHLCMVYGLDYCASETCYSRIKQIIKESVEAIPELEFTESRELGHINHVDPLGITYMRIRGMWGIENPWRVFQYVYTRDMRKDFNFMCIINDAKWQTFENRNELLSLTASDNRLQIQNIEIKNPDNPARLVPAKLITFSM